MYVYKITNTTNGKPYVGQTQKKIEKRFMEHFWTKTPLGEAMRQCGLENFTIEIIEECETREQAQERERFWIKVLKSKQPNGYNRSDGGEGGYGSRNVENTDSARRTKYYYPAIFFPDETGTGHKVFGVAVPDIDGCFSQGEDLTDAMNWAVDAIGTMLDGVDEKDYPKPSKVSDLDLSEYPPDSIVNIIEFDSEKYFHTIKYAAQKKGLTIKKTAELLGAPYRTIQNYWNGERRPPAWLERLIVKEIESS